MDPEIDRLLNSHWWTTALIQRRQLDVAAHQENRAQQSVDPHAVHMPDPEFVADPDKPDAQAPRVPRPTHGSDDYTLTDFEREWLTQRINDQHVLHLQHRDEGRAVLVESHEDHEARELHAKALDYFGGTHDETREKMKALHKEHRRMHGLVVNRLAATDKATQPKEHGMLDDVRVAHEQTLRQIEEYGPLIDRHIATVKGQVAEQRRLAQQRCDDCEKLLSIEYNEHLQRELKRVEQELRAAAQNQAV